MSAKTEPESTATDKLKLAAGIGVAIAAIIGFYAFPDQSLLLRVVGLLAAVGVGAAIAYTSTPGRAFWNYVSETRNEVRKVVWPTRTETLQTTLIVLAMVVVVAIMLWIIDAILGWLVRMLLG